MRLLIINTLEEDDPAVAEAFFAVTEDMEEREKKGKVQQQHDGRKPFEERRGLRQAAGNVGNLYHRE